MFFCYARPFHVALFVPQNVIECLFLSLRLIANPSRMRSCAGSDFLFSQVAGSTFQGPFPRGFMKEVWKEP